MNIFPTIIIPAYNRPKALIRLLNSLNKSNYSSKNIRLVISIEGGANINVIKVASDFLFLHGEKNIIRHKHKLGLRNHIVWCGDQTEKYGSIILLEDDLLVDKFFFEYAHKSLQFYNDDENVAGIALYSPCRNEYCNLPFIPLHNGSSTYPMQIPCSWGQAWSCDQWMAFKEWYDKSDNEEVNSLLSLPDTVKNWPESSWKKYFGAYMVKREKFFIYPYISFTTNCSDSGGTHIKSGTNIHQVTLPSPTRVTCEVKSFFKVHQSPVSYDAFFEPHADTLKKGISYLSDKNFEVDFYASKPIEYLKCKEYVITTRYIENPIVSYQLKYKPIELNLYFNSITPDNENEFSAYLAKSDTIRSSRGASLKIKLLEYYSIIDLSKLRNIYQNECKDKIYSSLSWKITKPLRILGHYLMCIVKFYRAGFR